MPSTVVMPITSGSTAARPRKKTSDSRSSTREGEHLRAAEVRLDAVADLLAGDSAAAERDALAVLEAVARGGDRLGLVRVGAQRRGQVDRRAVAAGGPAATARRPGTEASRRSGRRRRPVAPSRTMPGSGSTPVAASMRSIARAEFASSAVKPPESRSEPATGPPRTAAIRTKAARRAGCAGAPVVARREHAHQ